jgi:hypothetical protein
MGWFQSGRFSYLNLVRNPEISWGNASAFPILGRCGKDVWFWLESHRPQEGSMKSLVYGGRRVLIMDEALLPCLLGFGPGSMVDGTDMTLGARKAVLFHPHIVGDGPQSDQLKVGLWPNNWRSRGG